MLFSAPPFASAFLEPEAVGMNVNPDREDPLTPPSLTSCRPGPTPDFGIQRLTTGLCQGCIRTAVHRRRRGGFPHPGPSLPSSPSNV